MPRPRSCTRRQGKSCRNGSLSYQFPFFRYSNPWERRIHSYRSKTFALQPGRQRYRSKKHPVAYPRLVAPLEWRVQNVMQDLQISAEDARKQIEQLEQERRQWVKQIGFADIDDASNYHLVINTARVSTETLVQLVKASLAAVASGGLLPGAAPVSRPI